MKLVHVVGARPNFMKLAPVLRALSASRHDIRSYVVHTGQHWDDEMSATFFRELEIPKPDVNLNCGGGSHAEQTAMVMRKFEAVVLKQEPDLVVVYGDVNSTLAAALVAAKMCVPVAHVEAGLRCGDMSMPEEINRRLTDHVSTLLFSTDAVSTINLVEERVLGTIRTVGDVMLDTLYHHAEDMDESDVLERLGLDINGFCVLTLHRPANVDDERVLADIVEGVRGIARDVCPVVFPIHPRTRQRFKDMGVVFEDGVVDCPPLGYFDFMKLVRHAVFVVTDSGSLQTETTALGVPCVTLRPTTERPVTLERGTNVLFDTKQPDVSTRLLGIARRAKSGDWPAPELPPIWDGKAARRIREEIEEWGDLGDDTEVELWRQET
jgi:UDP-N-acetylglucosamine 2-epimerase (non-hydrolysing)